MTPHTTPDQTDLLDVLEPPTLDDLDSETVEDLDVGDAADDIAGGWDFTTTTCLSK